MPDGEVSNTGLEQLDTLPTGVIVDTVNKFVELDPIQPFIVDVA